MTSGIQAQAPLGPRLTIAALVAAGLLVAAVAARVARPAGLELHDPRSFVDLLLAAACLSLALLTLRRAPAVAWPALVLAATLAATEPFQLARALFGPDGRLVAGPTPTGPDAGRWLSASLLVTVAAVATAAVGALYAGRPERRLAGWVGPVAIALVGWLAIACGATILLTMAGWHNDPALTWADLLTWPVRVWFVLVVALAAAGLAGDLWPAAVRASARMAAAPGEVGGATFAWIGAFVDELSGRAASRHAAAEAERSRLASELHAEVLPSLRRAQDDLAEDHVGPATIAALREVADRLEQTMADRRDVVLEQLGLVEALEILAERVQDRAGVEVGITVLDEGRSTGRPPLAVETAALRIGRLAVDNAVVHGDPRSVELAVSSSPDGVTIEVSNDGRPIEPDASERAIRDGRRGLVEIREIAASVGGRVVVGTIDGTGARVRFDWPA